MLDGRVPIEMVGSTEFPRIGELPYFLTLAPYGVYWFLLQETVGLRAAARPVPRSAPKPPDALDLRPLLLGLDWSSAFDTATHEILERDYLPVHLATRRWFAAARPSAQRSAFAITPAQRRRRTGIPHAARRARPAMADPTRIACRWGSWRARRPRTCCASRPTS